jgi:RNA polymerase sigma factor (sigma-70 family)
MVSSHDGETPSQFSADSSVSQWIVQLKDGKAEAAEKLWQRYFEKVVGLARKKLGSAPRQMMDEEDIAVNVFDNLWQGAAKGKFPELRNRDNLWPLLVVLTSRRVYDHFRHEKQRPSDAGGEELDTLIAKDPSAEYVAIMTENFSRLFAMLEPKQKKVAQAKLEGLENTEIAKALGCSLRTVERKLQIIREIWDRNP